MRRKYSKKVDQGPLMCAPKDFQVFEFLIALEAAKSSQALKFRPNSKVKNPRIFVANNGRRSVTIGNSQRQSMAVADF
uniref:Uncharacterized protein n=1 Tax=Romanomermis culicivorax TaxID=13658 RepID=A0A915I8Q4_ROMCU